MTRVLELIVALIIVAVVAVVAGLIMPGSGHVERSMVIGKDMRQVYDVLDNFRRFPEYSQFSALDPQIKYSLGGKAFGPGAEISWDGDGKKVSDGKLTIGSAKPNFNDVNDLAKSSSIIWNLNNDWRGNDKHFTLDMERQGRTNRLTKVTWSYDVDYGWNLLSRYGGLYIHGEPDAFIQASLTGMQNLLSSVNNVDYGDLAPKIVQTKPTPMLLVSTSIERKGGLDALNDATDAAEKQITDAAKKLGVNVVGPRVLFTTNYGDQTYTFDVAMPIDSNSLTIDGQSYQLTPARHPDLSATAQAAAAGSVGAAVSAAKATSSAAESSSSEAPANAGSADDENAPASSSSSDKPAKKGYTGPAAGSRDELNRLVINKNVRALLAFGGPALVGQWNGTFAGVPHTRDEMQAYALTHGYKFDSVVNRFYNILAVPEQKDENEEVTHYARYDVYLPLSSAPEQTPEQAAGVEPPTFTQPSDEPAASGSAPSPAGTAPTPAGTAATPAEASTVE